MKTCEAPARSPARLIAFSGYAVTVAAVTRPQFLVGGVMLLFSIYFVLSAVRLSFVGLGGRTGPGSFPLVISVLMLVIGSLDLVLTYRLGPGGAVERSMPLAGEARVALLLFAALVAFDLLGYVLTLSILITSLMLFFGERRWQIALPVALAFAVSSYALFALVVGVRLPPLPLLGL